MIDRFAKRRRAIAVFAAFVTMGGAVGVGLKQTLSAGSAEAAGPANTEVGDTNLADRLMKSWWDCSISNGSKFLDPDGDGEGGLIESDEAKAACTYLYLAGAAAVNADTLPMSTVFQAIGKQPVSFWACLDGAIVDVGLNGSAEFRSSMGTCAAKASITLPVATG